MQLSQKPILFPQTKKSLTRPKKMKKRKAIWIFPWFLHDFPNKGLLPNIIQNKKHFMQIKGFYCTINKNYKIKHYLVIQKAVYLY